MKLICFILGHKYRVLETFTRAARKVRCPRCKTVWYMNDRHKVLFEWDLECEDLAKDEVYLYGNEKHGVKSEH